MRIHRSLPLLLCLVSAGLSAHGQTSFKFSFGAQPVAGYTQVSSTAVYADSPGYGWEPSTAVITGTNATSDPNPFYFSVKLPEGNYKVTATLGGDAAANTTIKAELRRLMIEKDATDAGKTDEKTFIVNLRQPQISSGGAVHLKSRETDSEIWDWDNKMTLEFNGSNPSLSKLEVEPADVTTVYIIGDSTVCDQPAEPWDSWGQMLTRFFKPDVAVANHAESGEALISSLHAKRFDKIFSLMKKGDYLFIQFGHNDQKSKDPNALQAYTDNLKQVVEKTVSMGATPVLVTSMERKTGVTKDTLAGYPDAVRSVAASEKCALVDLNKMSRVFYTALGPDLNLAFQDGTHHNNYGSYELAQCVILGIKQSGIPLAKSIVDGFNFDPSKPDPVRTFDMPVSPQKSAAKPLGS